MRKSLSTPRAWCTRARLSFEARNDAGMSLIELVVALLIITIVLLAGLTAVTFGLTSSNTQRLKVEATNLALTTMEQDEPLAQSLNIGQTTTTQTINGTTFTVVSTISELDQNGGSLVSTCASNATSQSEQIWQVAVIVTWAHMAGLPPISQSTEVSPGESTAQDLANSELAIGVVGATGLPLTVPLNFTVTPVGTGSYVPPNPPAGNTSPVGKNFNTGNSGCGIVTGLSTNPLFTYTVTIGGPLGNTGWVSTGEYSDANPAGDPTATDLQSLAGQVTRSPVFQLAPGVTTTVSLQAVLYNCAGGTPTPACYVNSGAGFAQPIATLPITFGNTLLTGGQYTFGNTGTPTATSSALLYPYSSYSVWSGDTSQGDPADSALPPATGSFYTGAPPLADIPAPVTLPIAINATTATVKVPTYDLSLQVAGACAGASLVATETAGSDSYSLNPLAGAVSASGMPLGQFLLSSTGGVSCPALKSTGAGGLYVWITPTGVYQAAAEMTNPYTGTLIAAGASVLVTE